MLLRSIARASGLGLLLLACRSEAPPSTPAPPPPTPAVAEPPAIAPPTPQSSATPSSTPTAPTASHGADVSFGLVRVAPEPSSLTVVVRNHTAAPLPMIAFQRAACFAHFWLRIELATASGKPLRAADCAVRDFPGIAQPIAVGAEAKFVLPLRELFPTLRTGDFTVRISWDPTRLRDVLGPDAGFDILSSSQNETEISIAKPRKELVIKRGESVTLPGGAELHFAGHSHKSVDAESAPGPLMVGGTFTVPGGPPDKFHLSIFPDEKRTFFLGETHAFELMDYVYDESMRLRYYGPRR